VVHVTNKKESMQTEPGRFAVSTQASRTLLVAKRQVASSEIDAIARRRARRESDVTTPSTTHVSLSEAFARQRQRDAQAQ
jgi:hypothetical protein